MRGGSWGARTRPPRGSVRARARPVGTSVGVVLHSCTNSINALPVSLPPLPPFTPFPRRRYCGLLGFPFSAPFPRPVRQPKPAKLAQAKPSQPMPTQASQSQTNPTQANPSRAHPTCGAQPNAPITTRPDDPSRPDPASNSQNLHEFARHCMNLHQSALICMNLHSCA